MGKSQRTKGISAEREFAHLINGKRVPLSGAQNGYTNDVIGLGIEWEVKRRKNGFKTIYDVLEDERERPDAMAFRVDRKDWIVAMKLQTFLNYISQEGTK